MKLRVFFTVLGALSAAQAALADALRPPELAPKTVRRRRRWSSGLAAGVIPARRAAW